MMMQIMNHDAFRFARHGVAFLLLAAAAPAHALVEVDPLLPNSLKTVKVPEPTRLSDFVRDKQAAIVLGKALFWDQQAGSDGTACATCHFHAGTDNRTRNQLNPGQRRAGGGKLGNKFDFSYTQSQQFGPTVPTGSNYQLKRDDFPFHRLADPTERNSEVLFDSDDVVGSQGVYARKLIAQVNRKEVCVDEASLFRVRHGNARQTAPRNAPSIINAVFNYRNFWDGRANDIFNGLDPFGERRPFDGRPGQAIYAVSADDRLVPEAVALDNASLASQAVGPALNGVEMSCAGKEFRQLGRKMLGAVPLKLQTVDSEDSVLGAYAAENGKGLRGEFVYRNLVQKAFQPKYWNSAEKLDGYSLMENNFSLFWGLAIQLYEATLVSDDTPYDRFKENPWEHPLTEQQLSGMNVFAGKGMCLVCHRGSEFTAASRSHVTEAFVERMPLADGGTGLYDTGFYNIGVRPTYEDLGLGGTDAWGNPLSFTRQATAMGDGSTDMLSFTLDPIVVSSSNFLLGTGMAVSRGEREAVDGSFKTPTLRNVELTGPYFHNGSYATLRQVIEFYHRGGDRRDATYGDSSGYGGNPSNLAPDLAGHIDPWDPTDYSSTLNLTNEEMDDLVEFLKALTDDRVRWEQAPFDHPSLTIPNGHEAKSVRPAGASPATLRKAAVEAFRAGNLDAWVQNLTAAFKQGAAALRELAGVSKQAILEAKTSLVELPAVGAAGREAKGLEPLKSFEENLD
jgi:cytochrome c peroxidase